MVFEQDIDEVADLQAKLNEKAQEAERIRGEIERAKLDAQLLRLQLQAHGIFDESMIPPDMMSGGLPKASEVPYLEIKRLFEWLADNCDMSAKQTFIVPDPEVKVGNDSVYLGHMAQWRLRVTGGLRFSIPFENESELLMLLRKAHTGTLNDDELERFGRNWVLMTTDIRSDGEPIPALFLINQASKRACVVSSWPTVPVQVVPPMLEDSFDPGSFFDCSKSLQSSSTTNTETPLVQRADEVRFIDTNGYVSMMVSTETGLEWARFDDDGSNEQKAVEEIGVSFDTNDEFTVTGPYGPCTICEPPSGPAQRWLVSGLVAVALEHGVRVLKFSVPTDTSEADSPTRQRSMASGEIVEVLYGEHWLRGVLQAVNGEIAEIRCYVDTNGAITRAPLDRVRLAGFNLEESEAETEHVAGGH